MKWLRRIGLAVLVLLVADQSVGWIAVRDGRFRDVWLPPLARLRPQDRKRLEEVLARLRAGEEEAHSTGLRLRAFDAELGWTNLPGERGYYATNSLGARSAREYAPEPEPGVLRIACYGESFTYCAEVPNKVAWPAILESMDSSIEAINMGVSAYGTDQALLRFRRRGLLGARVALIGFLTENIGRNVNRYRPLYQLGESTPAVKPRFVLSQRGLELVPVIYDSREDLLEAVLSGRVVSENREHEYWQDRSYFPPFSPTARIFAGIRARDSRRIGQLWEQGGGEPFRVTMQLIERFYREALSAGAEHALVLVFPTHNNLRQALRGKRTPGARLVQLLERRNIAALDLTETLAQAPKGARLYKKAHLNAHGNQLVAAAVRAWIKERYPSR